MTLCKCSDVGCPHHRGLAECRKPATTTLYRVDMTDETGTDMCADCADDAMGSGLFSDCASDDDADEIDETETDDADAEPSEPEEDDITTTDHRKFYQSGKLAFELIDTQAKWGDGTPGFELSCRGNRHHEKTFSSIEHAIRAYMDAEQFWPNCWFISDHGNAHLMDLGKGN